MGPAPIDLMWSSFTRATGVKAGHSAWSFGDESDPALATLLGNLVLSGPKRATAGTLAGYEEEGSELPEVGEYSVILDGAGTPLCIIRTTEVTVKPFAEVDESFAWDEGEGDRTLKWWKEAHVRFFARIGEVITAETPMVLERFDLVWPPS